MRKALGLLVVLGLAATPALAQRITIDYDHDFDFNKVKTFEYVEIDENKSADQLMDGRIKTAIINQLQGLTQVDSDPDLYITYHLSSKDHVVLSTTGYGGGWGGGWGAWGGGMGMSTTTASTYTDGTLIVDAYEPGEKKMVWRGTGTVTMKSKPEKRAKQIDNIMAKMGAKWAKILKNQGE